jgi:hypothetical protein
MEDKHTLSLNAIPPIDERGLLFARAKLQDLVIHLLSYAMSGQTQSFNSSEAMLLLLKTYFTESSQK